MLQLCPTVFALPPSLPCLLAPTCLPKPLTLQYQKDAVFGSVHVPMGRILEAGHLDEYLPIVLGTKKVQVPLWQPLAF